MFPHICVKCIREEKKEDDTMKIILTFQVSMRHYTHERKKISHFLIIMQPIENNSLSFV